MDPVDKKLSQKEYLKKYLSIGSKDGPKKKKKKKKLPTIQANRMKIIDDDLDLKNMNIENIQDEDDVNLDYLGDEAPQVVAVIDESGFSDTKKWKTFGAAEENDDGMPDQGSKSKSTKNISSAGSFSKGNDSDASPPRPLKKESKIRNSDSSIPRRSKGGRAGDFDLEELKGPKKPKRRCSDSSDFSPPRRFHQDNKGSDSDVSLPRKSRAGGSDSDVDVTRKKHGKPGDTRRRQEEHLRRSDSDPSPPRRKDKKRSKQSDSDPSPPRKNSGERDRGKSKNQRHSPDRHYNKDRSCSKGKRDAERDSTRYKTDSSSKRRARRSSSDSDVPVRRKHKESPKRSRAHSSDSDLSPGRNYDRRRNGSIEKRRKPKEKLATTLDGKKAGLQDARNLKEELRSLREKEDQAFRDMDASKSGAAAAAVYRDRKTGRVRDLKAEEKKKKELSAKEAAMKEKYDKWGKGLRQIEAAETHKADVLHEMSKPLARFIDDDDLDRRLRAQEREGDPMLEYIRKKQVESISVDDGIEVAARPRYKGMFMPNRFGIPPGYRWDGVDRSNGYEQKWFDQQNAKKAREEEAYKWSVSDM